MVRTKRLQITKRIQSELIRLVQTMRLKLSSSRKFSTLKNFDETWAATRKKTKRRNVSQIKNGPEK